MKLEYQSFKPDGFNKNRDQVGTVSGSLNDQPIVCRAYQSTNGDLTIAGFIGKYKNQEQLWLATVWVNKFNEVRFFFGCDSRAGRITYSNLTFQPDYYFERAPKGLFYEVIACEPVI